MSDAVGLAGAGPARPPRGRLRWRLRAPLVVAGARLRAHPGRMILVIVGVAASNAMLVGVIGGSLIARDRAVQAALAALPPSERSFRVDAFGLPPEQDYARADRTVRAALAPLAARPPQRMTVFRVLRIDHELLQLAGVDDLGRFVRLRSGRLPRFCHPEHCEVLQIGKGGRRAPDEGAIHLLRVGAGELSSPGVFGSSLEAARQGGQAPPVLLASGAQAFDRLPAFDGLYRVYSWIAPLEPKHVHVWEVSRILRLETRAQTSLARSSDLYRLSGPDQALSDARAHGRVAAGRMVLLGGEVSALLLGFALVAAIGLRRGLSNERRRLLQRGARGTQVWLAQAAEVSAMTLLGSAFGVGLGVLSVALLARAARLPGGAVLEHSLASLAAVSLVVLAWLGATVAVLAVARVREREPGARRPRLLDVAALGAAAAVVLGLARGGLNADALSSGGDRTLLLFLPGLSCFVAAVVAARLLGPVMQLAERASRRGPTSLRLALLALARAPSRTTATMSFVLVSLALAFFAGSYRSTLNAGARDEAAFAVPLDFTLTEGQRLVLPFQAATLDRYRQLAGGVRAFPVLRRSADVAGPGASVLSPTVLGLPAGVLARLHWRSDFSRLRASTLGARLAAEGPAALHGALLPPGATAVSARVEVRGVAVDLALVAEDRTGEIVVVPLGERGAGTWRLRGRLLPANRLRQIFGVEVSPAPAVRDAFAHHEAQGEQASAPSGSLALGPLVATTRAGRRRLVTAWRGWIARRGAGLRPGKQLRISYVFTEGQTMLLRPPQATDGRPLRVIVSPEVARSAGPGDTITLDFHDVTLPARIVGVADRFPASEQEDEGFVVADESRLATALDADDPGTGTPGELWLSAPDPSAARVEADLRRPPFSPLVLASRRDIEHALATEPLARGITLTLGVAGLAALLLAAVGFWVGLVSELRDERGELFDLESQGVAPETLRRQFRLRALGVVTLGALAGAAVGLLLSRLVVSVVRISASAASPRPPLRVEPAWALAGIGLAALLVALSVMVELTTRRAFRGESPPRASWSLE